MSNSNLSNLHVLLVEDEKIIREHTMTSLQYLVQEVQAASNGEEALEVLKNFKPDIIISDLKMPIMNGTEFVKIVRKENKKIPIVILTAHTNEEYLLELIEMHIENFVTKPISFEKLITVLHKCAKLVKKDDNKNISLPFNYKYNWEKKSLFYEEEEIKLTRKEILLLELLIKNRNRVVSYDEIEGAAWEDNTMTSGAIRSLIRALRKKLPKNIIDNLSGIGYTLAND